MNLYPRAQRALLIGLSIASLAACHSGGDDDEEDEDDIGGIAEDEDATGIWGGSITVAGVARSFRVNVAPNGDFTGLMFPSPGAQNGRSMVGNGSVSGTVLTASGTAFAGPNGPFPNTSLIATLAVTNGRVAEHATLEGTLSAGGETGTFSLTHQTALTNRGASLSMLAGTYSVYPPPAPGAPSAVLTINSAGVADYQVSTGCIGNGSFAVIDPAVNMYSFTLTLSSCGGPTYTATGLAVLDDTPGATNNLIGLIGAPALRERVFGFGGTR